MTYTRRFMRAGLIWLIVNAIGLLMILWVMSVATHAQDHPLPPPEYKEDYPPPPPDEEEGIPQSTEAAKWLKRHFLPEDKEHVRKLIWKAHKALDEIDRMLDDADDQKRSRNRD